MADRFLERLAQGTVLCDGAMGTMLYARGISFEQCFDELNISQPALVQGIHNEYLRAGAEIVETNTFGANRFKLEAHGLATQLADLNAGGVRLAQEAAAAAGRPAFVAASVGPLGIQVAPVGFHPREEARHAFREQIEALCSAGPDALILETFADLGELEQAILAAREVCSLPVVAQMTFTGDGLTPVGYTPAQVARHLAELQVDVIGANCSVGPAGVLAVVEQMIEALRDQATGKPVYFSAQPNAGFPEGRGGRIFYPATPEYLSEVTRRLVEAGVSLVGGCCGTTPDHIRAMRLSLDARTRLARPLAGRQVSFPRPEERPAAAEPPTVLQQKLDAGRIVVGVEVDPPRGFDLNPVLTGALILKEAGADVINIADSPRAQLRMSPWAVAHLVQTQVGIESVLHFPVRGRNLLRVHGDLLAAHALHVRNIFVVMGDPPAIGDYPAATDTHDVTPSGLTKLIKQNFNMGLDHAGARLGAPCSFTVGVACDMGAPDPAREIQALHRKVLAGADLALTQPVFDPEVARTFLRRYADAHGPLSLPLLVGIHPLASARHAEYLHNEVPGISIPEVMRERMRRAGADGYAEGLSIARELWAELRDSVRGVFLMLPFSRYEVGAELLSAIRNSQNA